MRREAPAAPRRADPPRVSQRHEAMSHPQSRISRPSGWQRSAYRRPSPCPSADRCAPRPRRQRQTVGRAAGRHPPLQDRTREGNGETQEPRPCDDPFRHEPPRCTAVSLPRSDHSSMILCPPVPSYPCCTT